MRKYPYYLYVHKTTFNVGPDIKRAIRRAKPEETDWYTKTQVANVGGYGPKLFEYSSETTSGRFRIGISEGL